MEVKRTLPEEPLLEFDELGRTRLWMKADDIDDELYQQHYIPTEYNTATKILTTQQYVPEFLKKLGSLSGKSNYIANSVGTCSVLFNVFFLNIIDYTGDRNYEYIQDKPIIERPIQYSQKRRSNVVNAVEDQIEQKYQKLIDEHEKTIKSMSEKLEQKDKITENLEKMKHLEEIDNLNKRYTKNMEEKEKMIEELRKKLKQKEEQTENLKKRIENSEALAAKEKDKYDFAKLQKIIDDTTAELQQMKDRFLAPIETSIVLSENENEILMDCVEFMHLNATVRANLATRNKAIAKKISSIEKIVNGSGKLYKKC